MILTKVTEMNRPISYDVLNNDISDEELQIVGIITTAENGDCRINKDNDQVVYTPNEGFTGMCLRLSGYECVLIEHWH